MVERLRRRWLPTRETGKSFWRSRSKFLDSSIKWLNTFQVFKPQGRLTLLEVYTDWAGPCTAMATILAKVKVSKRESNQLKKNLLTTSPTSSSSSSPPPPPSSSSRTTPARAADGEAWFKRWLPTPSYPHLCLRLCGHCPGERIYWEVQGISGSAPFPSQLHANMALHRLRLYCRRIRNYYWGIGDICNVTCERTGIKMNYCAHGKGGDFRFLKSTNNDGKWP